MGKGGKIFLKWGGVRGTFQMEWRGLTLSGH